MMKMRAPFVDTYQRLGRRAAVANNVAADNEV